VCNDLLNTVKLSFCILDWSLFIKNISDFLGSPSMACTGLDNSFKGARSVCVG